MFFKGVGSIPSLGKLLISKRGKKACTRTRSLSAKNAARSSSSLLENRNFMLRRVLSMNPKDAKSAVMPERTLASPSVKCLMLYVQHAENLARFHSSQEKIAPYTAVNASPKSRSSNNRHLSFWHGKKRPRLFWGVLIFSGIAFLN